ncbi:hypothetical protein EW146_g4588 [Bondarzewia mesenterica]|uniref:YDG domain-containing protein n=1 Tax=Bondarzewia mesenterica TaxID=1095465 RepID=A0A4S4LU41_9AGAM|nr:hypothetical protein EW146_g4588 [Bondarzewia mesenterica]
MPTAYELRRDMQVAANKKLLEALGLEALKPLRPPPLLKQAASKKRKTPSSESQEEKPLNKAPRIAAAGVTESPTGGLRRSGRNAGKTVDYVSVQERGQPTPVSRKVGIDHDTEPNRPMGKRKHNPKVFGSIPGVPVGTWEACSADSIHAPWVAGISGSSDGAYSIALSGGYEDDVDLGYAFTFTGSGGRDLKGTKNSPKNTSCDTRKPVRVIRGYKLKSPFAPLEGYRYDGLYVVEKAWMETGLNPKGYQVCKFALKERPALKRANSGKGKSCGIRYGFLTQFASVRIFPIRISSDLLFFSTCWLPNNQEHFLVPPLSLCLAVNSDTLSAMRSFMLTNILSLLVFSMSGNAGYAGLGLQHHPVNGLAHRNHRGDVVRALNGTHTYEDVYPRAYPSMRGREVRARSRSMHLACKYQPAQLWISSSYAWSLWTELPTCYTYSGACGGYNTEADFIVALNIAEWDNGAHCNEMITITVNGKSTQAQIVDECPGCSPGGLDLSPAIFRFYNHVIDGVLQGSWSYNNGAGNGDNQSSSAKPSPSSSEAPPPSSTVKPTPTTTITPPPSSSSDAQSTTTSSSSSSSISRTTSTSALPTSSSTHAVSSFASSTFSATSTSALSATASSSAAAAQQTLSPDDPQFLNVANIALLRLGSIIQAGASL